MLFHGVDRVAVRSPLHRYRATITCHGNRPPVFLRPDQRALLLDYHAAGRAAEDARRCARDSRDADDAGVRTRQARASPDFAARWLLFCSFMTAQARDEPAELLVRIWCVRLHALGSQLDRHFVAAVQYLVLTAAHVLRKWTLIYLRAVAQLFAFSSQTALKQGILHQCNLG